MLQKESCDIMMQNSKEFLIQDIDCSVGTEESVSKHVVSMIYEHNGRIPTRLVMNPDNQIERKKVCTPANCVDYPNEYFGERTISIDNTTHMKLNKLINGLVSSLADSKGELSVCPVYLDVVFSDGNRFFIQSYCVPKELYEKDYDTVLDKMMLIEDAIEEFEIVFDSFLGLSYESKYES